LSPSASPLAFRPVSVVHRLARRSQACPLSLRDLLRSLGQVRRPLPLVAAPLQGVVRAVLLAAKQAGAAVGLMLPSGRAPEPWFAAVAEASDQLAPGLPIFLAGEVAVAGGEADEAARRAWRLVEAGLTHLAVDVSALPVAERARAAARVAGYAGEREIAVEVILPARADGTAAEEAAAFLEELEGWGLLPDALGARFPAPDGEEALRGQARSLGALAAALGRTALVRRGPVTPLLLQVLRAAGVAAAEDGGRVLAAGLAALPEPRRVSWDGPQQRGAPAPEPDGPEAERLEALAFAEAASVIEAMGAGGTARAVEVGLAAAGRT
jgi:hypothetical protein